MLWAPEPVAAFLLLRRVAGLNTSLQRIRDVVGLLLRGAMLSTTLSATICVASLCLSSMMPWSGYWAAWWKWWLGDPMAAW